MRFVFFRCIQQTIPTVDGNNIAGEIAPPRTPDFNVVLQCATVGIPTLNAKTFSSTLSVRVYNINIEIGGAGGPWYTGNIFSAYGSLACAHLFSVFAPMLLPLRP